MSVGDPADVDADNPKKRYILDFRAGTYVPVQTTVRLADFTAEVWITGNTKADTTIGDAATSIEIEGTGAVHFDNVTILGTVTGSSGSALSFGGFSTCDASAATLIVGGQVLLAGDASFNGIVVQTGGVFSASNRDITVVEGLQVINSSAAALGSLTITAATAVNGAAIYASNNCDITIVGAVNVTGGASGGDTIFGTGKNGRISYGSLVDNSSYDTETAYPIGEIQESGSAIFDGTTPTSTQTGSSPLTTTGDLYGYDNQGTRIPVGLNGQVLTADSTDPAGIVYADIPTSPVGAAFVNQIFDDVIINSPPVVSGDVRLNASDQTTATEMYVSSETQPANDAGFLWESLQEGQYLGFWETDKNQSDSIYFRVTGPAVLTAGTPDWYTVPLEYTSGPGNLTDGVGLQIIFIANPDQQIPAGGTTGQLLGKASDDSYDTEWVDKSTKNYGFIISEKQPGEAIVIGALMDSNGFTANIGSGVAPYPYTPPDVMPAYYFTGTSGENNLRDWSNWGLQGFALNEVDPDSVDIVSSTTGYWCRSGSSLLHSFAAQLLLRVDNPIVTLGTTISGTTISNTKTGDMYDYTDDGLRSTRRSALFKTQADAMFTALNLEPANANVTHLDILVLNNTSDAALDSPTTGTPVTSANYGALQSDMIDDMENPDRFNLCNDRTTYIINTPPRYAQDDRQEFKGQIYARQASKRNRIIIVDTYPVRHVHRATQIDRLHWGATDRDEVAKQMVETLTETSTPSASDVAGWSFRHNKLQSLDFTADGLPWSQFWLGITPTDPQGNSGGFIPDVAAEDLGGGNYELKFWHTCSSNNAKGANMFLQEQVFLSRLTAKDQITFIQHDQVDDYKVNTSIPPDEQTPVNCTTFELTGPAVRKATDSPRAYSLYRFPCFIVIEGQGGGGPCPVSTSLSDVAAIDSSRLLYQSDESPLIWANTEAAPDAVAGDDDYTVNWGSLITTDNDVQSTSNKWGKGFFPIIGGSIQEAENGSNFAGMDFLNRLYRMPGFSMISIEGHTTGDTGFPAIGSVALGLSPEGGSPALTGSGMAVVWFFGKSDAQNLFTTSVQTTLVWEHTSGSATIIDQNNTIIQDANGFGGLSWNNSGTPARSITFFADTSLQAPTKEVTWKGFGFQVALLDGGTV